MMSCGISLFHAMLFKPVHPERDTTDGWTHPRQVSLNTSPCDLHCGLYQHTGPGSEDKAGWTPRTTAGEPGTVQSLGVTESSTKRLSVSRASPELSHLGKLPMNADDRTVSLKAFKPNLV